MTRYITFGSYHTQLYGWTLTGWELSAPEQKTNYIERPAGDGSWDLSTALSDGVARYHDRTLVATFERSDSDRRYREQMIRGMINQLDGLKMNITLPDDDDHYVVGRVHVAREYNDLAHAAVKVTAVCEPWKYSNTETVVTLPAGGSIAQLTNNGRRAMVPEITVAGQVVDAYAGIWQFNTNMTQGTMAISQKLKIYGGLVDMKPPYPDGQEYDTATLTITPNGPITLTVDGWTTRPSYTYTLMTGNGVRDFSALEDRCLDLGTQAQDLSDAFKEWMSRNMIPVEGASVSLTYNGQSVVLGPGPHKWPHLLLTPGMHAVIHNGTVDATVAYREAVLE